MHRLNRHVTLLAALAAWCLLAGCLERKERIIVNADGSVELRLLVEGEDVADMDEGDRLPQPGGMWNVRRTTRDTPEGKRLHRLEAARLIPGGVELPSSYAPRGDPLEKAYLQFPGELRIEQRQDGWYYHFTRTYQPRAYAQVGFLQDIAGEQAGKFAQNREEGQEAGLVEFKGVSEVLVRFAVSKVEIFAREAFLETNPNTPQDVWLAVREALDRLRAGADYDRLAAILKNAGQEDNSKVFEELEREFDTVTLNTIITTLQSSSFVVSTSAFRQRYEFHKKAFEITEDLGDDRFEVAVQMPGTIIAHNGDRQAGDSVVWVFPGKMLYDRKVELMVTSRVGN